MAKTIFEAYNGCKIRLESAGIEDYVFESKQIIKHITGMTGLEIISNPMKPLSSEQENDLELVIDRRLTHYPLQYILGDWDFYGRKFYIGEGVLIPRADTETVAEKCLDLIKDVKRAKVLDLCAGTGCIGITVACERTDASVILVEKYDTALEYTQKNVLQNGANNAVAVKGDVMSGDYADRKYDLIVSNPPYISDEDMKNLQPEVTFEPQAALAGGIDGLDFYRAIAKNYSGALNEGGKICFEIGIGEENGVTEILEQNGFYNIGTQNDTSDVCRVVFGTKK